MFGPKKVSKETTSQVIIALSWCLDTCRNENIFEKAFCYDRDFGCEVAAEIKMGVEFFEARAHVSRLIEDEYDYARKLTTDLITTISEVRGLYEEAA